MPSETPQQQRELNRLRQRCLPWDPAKVLPHNLTATAPVNAGGTALDQRSSALNAGPRATAVPSRALRQLGEERGFFSKCASQPARQLL